MNPLRVAQRSRVRRAAGLVEHDMKSQRDIKKTAKEIWKRFQKDREDYYEYVTFGGWNPNYPGDNEQHLEFALDGSDFGKGYLIVHSGDIDVWDYVSEPQPKSERDLANLLSDLWNATREENVEELLDPYGDE